MISPFSFDDSNPSNGNDETPIRARRKNNRNKASSLPLILGGGFVLLLLVGGGIAFAWWKFGKSSGGPIAAVVGQSGLSETREGDNWTHAELLEHLKKKGIKWESEAGVPGDAQRNSLVMLGFSDPSRKVVEIIPQREGEQINSIITIERAKTIDEAKEHAGVDKHSFAWGRFVFFVPIQEQIVFQIDWELTTQKMELIRKALR